MNSVVKLLLDLELSLLFGFQLHQAHLIEGLKWLLSLAFKPNSGSLGPKTGDYGDGLKRDFLPAIGVQVNHHR